MDNSHGYLGLYKWDEQEPIPFIGAENNALMVANKQHLFGRLWLELYRSRFNYAWNNSRPVINGAAR